MKLVTQSGENILFLMRLVPKVLKISQNKKSCVGSGTQRVRQPNSGVHRKFWHFLIPKSMGV